MADLILKKKLNLVGPLKLNPSGGKVLIDGTEALVQVTGADPPQCGSAPPVMLPPPPTGPQFPQPTVWIINSFNQTVTAGAAARPIVALGMVMQGQAGAPWPGMMQPSTGNTGPVTINGVLINVKGDMAMIFPSGGTATFNASGQT